MLTEGCTEIKDASVVRLWSGQTMVGLLFDWLGNNRVEQIDRETRWSILVSHIKVLRGQAYQGMKKM